MRWREQSTGPIRHRARDCLVRKSSINFESVIDVGSNTVQGNARLSDEPQIVINPRAQIRGAVQQPDHPKEIGQTTAGTDHQDVFSTITTRRVAGECYPEAKSGFFCPLSFFRK
jgi:hypothetical protein